MTDKRNRPLGVGLVFILILIAGLFTVVAGVLRLFNLGDNRNVGITASVVTIVIGVIYLLIARGISHGSRIARLIVVVVTVLAIASAVWALIAVPGLWLAVVVQILFNLLILALLYTSSANRYFAD